MKLRSLAVSAAALALAATGTVAGLTATAASAAPPVHHTITATALQLGATRHIGPNVTVTQDTEYTSAATAPGFTRSGVLTEVCVNVPHATPPTATTVLAVCNWSMTGLPLTVPRNTLHGTAVLNGTGSVGRVTGGTGAWRGAFSVLPNQTTFRNEAPRVQLDTFNFFLP